MSDAQQESLLAQDLVPGSHPVPPIDSPQVESGAQSLLGIACAGSRLLLVDSLADQPDPDKVVAEALSQARASFTRAGKSKWSSGPRNFRGIKRSPGRSELFVVDRLTRDYIRLPDLPDCPDCLTVFSLGLDGTLLAAVGMPMEVVDGKDGYVINPGTIFAVEADRLLAHANNQVGDQQFWNPIGDVPLTEDERITGIMPAMVLNRTIATVCSPRQVPHLVPLALIHHGEDLSMTATRPVVLPGVPRGVNVALRAVVHDELRLVDRDTGAIICVDLDALANDSALQFWFEN